ncbi:MAG: hypothetical protein ABMA64_36305 [Myxococcota bacterium]
MVVWLAAAALGAPGKKAVEVPIDVGVGPAANLLFGPVRDEQSVLGGIAFSAEAVLDHQLLKKFKKRIPAQYRKQVLGMDEIRITHPLVPRTIWISPKVGDATVEMYGVQLRPVGLGLPLLDGPVRLDIGVGLIASYFYLNGDALPGPTHFLRPGIDPGIELEVPFSDTYLLSGGWTSQLYLPQPVGGSILEFGPLDASICHLGQAFVKVHLRFPKRIKP